MVNVGKKFADLIDRYPEFEQIRQSEALKDLHFYIEPCSAKDYIALDFLIGEWKGQSAYNPKLIETMKISKIVGGCGLKSEYSIPTGYTSNTLFYYDKTINLWVEVELDSYGDNHIYRGKFIENSLVLKSINIKGRLFKSTRYLDSAKRLINMVEYSDNTGVTWKEWYKGTWAKDNDK